jgi:hypothetical protein
MNERSEVQTWLNHISAYDRTFKKWQSRVEKILKRYRDDGRKSNDSSAKFNILWSNVQTLVPACFSRLPQPDVSRRFRDNDPVGRVASLILERALDFEVQHYPDYRATMKQVVHDRFLGGRGTAWARYEPHFRAAEQQLPPEGVAVSEDVEVAEELDYECAPVDYVHWKDFGHSVARTWEEVTRVWRRVYMTMPAKVERFGEELAKKIPHDSKPKERGEPDQEADDGSWIYEGWDKDTKEAVWFHKNLADFLDQRPDPLGLEGFFPCPKPLYATLTNDSLEPVPDFTLYQDQANELDTLSDRIDGLIKALQVKGGYDASVPELARLFTEGTNGTLIPIKNWMAFAEKNGLQGALALVDLKPIAEALKVAYEAFVQVIERVYQITGISDIVRGETDPNETLGAQKMKGQFVSLRLRDTQQDVALFATSLLQLKAQIVCGKFAPETILEMACAEQLNEADKQFVQPAMALLLGDRAGGGRYRNPLRPFRIEVNADTLVQLDEQAEKEAANELLVGIGAFLEKAVLVAQAAPQLVPMLMELLKFAVTRYKVGKSVEGAIDQALDQMKQAAQQPKPPDPALEADRMKAEAEMQRTQADMRIAPIEADAKMKTAEAGVMKANLALQTAQVKAVTPQPQPRPQ